MENQFPHIIIFTGPTGGHFFPALAFAESFKKRVPGACLELVTSQRGRAMVESLKEHPFDRIYYLTDFPFPRRLSVQTPIFLVKLTTAFWKTLLLLSEKKVDLVVGFGSYVAFPGAVVASWKKIPVLIHEQNAEPGKATQMLERYSDIAALSFDQTRHQLKAKRMICTGMPIREALQLKANGRVFKSGAKPFTVLIVGGSQGAKKLNRICVSAFSGMGDEEKRDYVVIHITGSEDYEWIKEKYRSLNLQARVYPFYQAMEELYGEADLAITRAGAGTLFELALFELPAIVVPYAFAGGHQKKNAEIFHTKGAVTVLLETDLEEKRLRAEIRNLHSSPERMNKMKTALRELSVPDADRRLTELAFELTGSRSYASV